MDLNHRPRDYEPREHNQTALPQSHNVSQVPEARKYNSCAIISEWTGKN